MRIFHVFYDLVRKVDNFFGMAAMAFIILLACANVFMRYVVGKPWGWVAFSGAVSILLGVMIVAQWPASSLFVLGLFLGIDLIFIGSGWITMGLALKKRA